MKKKILIVTFLLGWVVSGCLATNATPAPIPIKIIKTSMPTQTPIQLTDSSTPVVLAIPANLPPLSIENRKDTLTSLVQENGGCQLPCIFGITPGVSDTLTVKGFIKYFGANSREADNQIDDISIDTYSNYDWTGVYLRFFENRVDVSIGLAIQIANDKVKRMEYSGHAMQLMDIGAKKLYGDPYYDSLLKSFSLSSILNTYGQPEQIIIRSVPDDFGHPSPPAQYTFSFVLFYPRQGFVVEYIAVRAESENDYVGCPTKSYVTNISSWNSNESTSITEAVEHFSNLDGISKVNIGEYMQLQDVTPMSIEDFYNTFKIQNSDECVHTPKENWPDKTY